MTFRDRFVALGSQILEEIADEALEDGQDFVTELGLFVAARDWMEIFYLAGQAEARADAEQGRRELAEWTEEQDGIWALKPKKGKKGKKKA